MTLAGGILPRIVDLLDASAFRAAFESKAPVAELARRIPTRLIVRADSVLGGMAAPAADPDRFALDDAARGSAGCASHAVGGSGERGGLASSDPRGRGWLGRRGPPMTSSRLPDSVSIRPLRTDDAEGIVALSAACMAVERNIGPISAESWTKTIALSQFGGGRHVLVALDGQAIVAVAESSLRNQGHRSMRNLKLSARL